MRAYAYVHTTRGARTSGSADDVAARRRRSSEFFGVKKHTPPHSALASALLRPACVCVCVCVCIRWCVGFDYV